MENQVTASPKFNMLMMQLPMGVMLMRGLDMKVEMANKMYCDLVDRNEAQLVGQNLSDALPEIVGQGILEILQNVYRTGVPYEGHEFRADLMRHGRMTELYFNFVYHPVREDDGVVSGIIVVVNEVTNIVQAKKSLTESEKQFRSLIMLSPIAMAIWRGEDMVVELTNNALLKLWKRTAAEVEGKKLLDIFPELAGQKFPQIMQEVYRTGVVNSEKGALAYVDTVEGLQKYYLDFMYAPLYDSEAKVNGIMVTMIDVTQQMEARKKIEEAENRSRLAIEAANLGTFEWELDSGKFIFSDRLAEIFGYSPSPAVTHINLIERYLPEDKHIREAANRMALTSGKLTYEARILWPDGSIRWLQINGKVTYDEHKQPLVMYGTGLDITEQRMALAEIAESEARFRLLADSMPQQIWTSDDKGIITYYNKSVFDYTGHDKEHLDQDNRQILVHPEDLPESTRLWRHSIATGENYVIEHRFMNNQGQYRWHLTRAVPQKDSSGNIQMWVGTTTDIHDRRMMTDELEKHIELRTQELKQANEELVRTNNELEQFAFIASHDLQEPLRKIRTFIGLVMKGSTERQTANYLEKINSSAGRMSVLIKDVLDYSRIVNRADIYVAVNLNEVLKNVITDFELLIEQKQAVIDSSGLPTITGINLQLNQLFTNLIGNSLKFSDTAPLIKITAAIATDHEVSGTKVLDPAQQYIKLTFSDNGIGFEQQYADKIFTIFQRLNERTKYMGTGIGLAMCKKIVENHNGYINAISELGKGALFNVYLPTNAAISEKWPNMIQ